MEGVLHNVETYFKNQMEYEWLEDEQAKQIIADVDQSIVESPQCIRSEVLGQIPPTKLSGGTKALLLIWNLSDRIVNASNCGDNCAKWLREYHEEEDSGITVQCDKECVVLYGKDWQRKLQDSQCTFDPDVVITEDSNSGYDFYSQIVSNQTICTQAGGKSKVLKELQNICTRIF